jgi:predicted DNA-binding transcriptional regulator YafY
LLERIRGLLGQGDGGAAAENLSSRIKVITPWRRPVASRFFERVAQALLERRRLRLRYFTRARGTASLRDVSPQRLVHYRNTWYLDAWCHRSDALRRFALDAIEAAEALEQPARALPLDEVCAEMDAGYGIYATGGRRHWATLHFDATAAQWASREEWHPEQKGRWLDGGVYELRLPFADATELVMDVLRQGEQVRAVAPPALVQAVKQRLAAALALYDEGAAPG